MTEMQYRLVDLYYVEDQTEWFDVESEMVNVEDYTHVEFRQKPVFVPGYYRCDTGAEQDVFWADIEPGYGYERVNVTVADD